MERTEEQTRRSGAKRLLPRQFRVRPDEMEALKALALADGISDSEVVRRALRAFLGLDVTDSQKNVKVNITGADYPRANNDPSPPSAARC